ncbi:MAG: hypothetical protein FJ284_04635 [Planctomycetes bacterium]|nr:hypothetical protein [Planctomycetota bacterium]
MIHGVEHAPRPLRPGLARVLLSIVIIGYLAGVIVAPLSGPPPASDLSRVLLQPFRPLLGGLYLSHGYRFFAPNPGPGHSIRWTITLPDGSSRSGAIPDARVDRPRLLYHRRFMVAEKIAGLVPPPDAPSEVRASARAEWLPLVKGVADNLLRAHGGERVTLEMVEHYLPGPDEVVEGRGGPDLVTPLGTFARRGRLP